MSPPSGLHRGVVVVLSTLMVVIGAAMVIATLGRGGGALALGVVLGLLFVGAGAARLYLAVRRDDG